MRIKNLSYFVKKEGKVATVQNVEICHYLKRKAKISPLITPNIIVPHFKSLKQSQLLYTLKVSLNNNLDTRSKFYHISKNQSSLRLKLPSQHFSLNITQRVLM